MPKHCSPNTDFYVTETNSLKDDHVNTNSNVLYPISTVTGPDFNNKEIAEQESESMLLDENRNCKCLDFNYKPVGKGLVMASLNINGLLAHIDEFRIFMSEADIDIISINETKLDFLINDNEVYIPGYEIARKDRTAWGWRMHLCKMQS